MFVALPPMIRLLASIALLLVLVFAQGLSLHGHLPDAHDGAGDSHLIQAHSHVLGGDLHDHDNRTPIDLLASALTGDQWGIGLAYVSAALWAIVAIVLWVCVRRFTPVIEFVYFGPPHLRRQSPRAPPF